MMAELWHVDCIRILYTFISISTVSAWRVGQIHKHQKRLGTRDEMRVMTMKTREQSPRIGRNMQTYKREFMSITNDSLLLFALALSSFKPSRETEFKWIYILWCYIIATNVSNCRSVTDHLVKKNNCATYTAHIFLRSNLDTL